MRMGEGREYGFAGLEKKISGNRHPTSNAACVALPHEVVSPSFYDGMLTNRLA